METIKRMPSTAKVRRDIAEASGLTVVSALNRSDDLIRIYPNAHDRASHPVLARLTETGTFVGAILRPGDTSFGAAEAPLIVSS